MFPTFHSQQYAQPQVPLSSLIFRQEQSNYGMRVQLSGPLRQTFIERLIYPHICEIIDTPISITHNGKKPINTIIEEYIARFKTNFATYHPTTCIYFLQQFFLSYSSDVNTYETITSETLFSKKPSVVYLHLANNNDAFFSQIGNTIYLTRGYISCGEYKNTIKFTISWPIEQLEIKHEGKILEDTDRIDEGYRIIKPFEIRHNIPRHKTTDMCSIDMTDTAH